MADQICWICGNEAKSGEHKIKRSDLRDVFGQLTQAAPLFFNSAKHKNCRVGSLDARLLKSPALICEMCNNNRSQPYDKAWEHFSAWLRNNHHSTEVGKAVRANRAFPYNTAKLMLQVHLYFVKLFGCHIKEANAAIDLVKFSSAFLTEKAHTNVYLKFGRGPTLPKGIAVGNSDMSMIYDDKKCVMATWIYYLDWMDVMVMFIEDGQRREGIKNSWHPRFGTNKIVISDFQ